MRNAYRILVRKPEEKRMLGRLRCRWWDNIKMDLKQGVRMQPGFICLRTGTIGRVHYVKVQTDPKVKWPLI
jgi:hypothetical protein